MTRDLPSAEAVNAFPGFGNLQIFRQGMRSKDRHATLVAVTSRDNPNNISGVFARVRLGKVTHSYKSVCSHSRDSDASYEEKHTKQCKKETEQLQNKASLM